MSFHFGSDEFYYLRAIIETLQAQILHYTSQNTEQLLNLKIYLKPANEAFLHIFLQL